MNVLFRRATTLWLAVVLLVPMLPGVPARGQTQSSVDADRVELEGRRTRNSKTFRNADGSLTTIVHGAPVHFEDANGQWREISTDVDASEAPGYSLETGPNSFKALFGDDAETYMKLRTGTRSFTFGLPGASRASAAGRGRGVSYDQILPGVDMEYDVLAEGLKQTLVLEGPNVPTRYRFTMEASGEGPLAVERHEGGSWAVYGSRPEPEFVLEAPHAFESVEEGTSETPPPGAEEAAEEPTPDPEPSPSEVAPSPSEAADDPAPSSSPGDDEPHGDEAPPADQPSPQEPQSGPGKPDKGPRPAVDSSEDAAADARGKHPLPASSDDNASLAVTETGRGRFVIDLEIDQRWLRDPERKFPVYLDPTITVQPTLQDAAFDAACGSCGPTVYEWLIVGAEASRAWRTALKFDLAGIPAGAAITSSKVSVWHDGYCFSSCWNYSHTIGAHRMTSPWSYSSTSSSLGFEPTALSTYTLPQQTWGLWMGWDITEATRQWVSGTQPNHGILLKRATEDATAGAIAPWASRHTPVDVTPKLEVTYTNDAVALLAPETLHSNGADLRWTPYSPPSGAPFQKFEIHRSTDPGFSPSPSTLVATLGDPALTSYRDTTAAPSRQFTYRIVANSSVSNAQTVTLPADGLATKRVQLEGAASEATTIVYDSDWTNCAVYGADHTLYMGPRSTRLHRSLLKFDLADVPSNATIQSARLSVFHEANPPAGSVVQAHKVTRAWKEGQFQNTCSGIGANWYHTDGASRWTTNGGDIAGGAVSAVTIGTSEPAGWHEFDITTLAGDWVAGRSPNHGVLLKTQDETLGGTDRTFYYRSDDYTGSTALRPKLVLTYSDGSRARAPQVALAAPSPGAKVSGGAATLAAAASDDGRVAAVDFLVDGTVVATDSSAPFSATWNSRSVVNGAHTLRARAVDDAGNTASSSDVSITVENSAPPTVSVTAPAAGANVTGTASLTANASDDVSVTKVEFLVDGLTVGEPDTVAPYGVSWNTLDPANPFYDGTHEITARASDGHGNATTSTVVSVNVTNTAASKFRAKIIPSTVVPQAMTYDPARVTQDAHYADLSITNTSGLTWAAGDVVARFRWLRPDGTGSFVSGDYAFGSDVAPGATRTIRVGMYPPTLPAGVDKAEYKVRFDLYSKTSAAWFADKGNPPSDHPVLVNKAIEATALGLERYYHYAGEGIGGGMSHLVNAASGNSLLRWSPFFSPGRGLSTSVDLTYNSLEDKSDSPVGNNFSLGISSLTRLGLPLDIHPNNADTIAGRSNKYIEFTDADGTTHRFTGNAAGGWDEPEGVHLWLRQYSTTDPQRKWALTRPDRVTYFFDDQGFPTSVQDKNGNRIEFAWENVPPGEDPGGTKRRITTITDAAGLGATPAPNRKFTIDYYSKAEAKKPQIRGKIEKITDHDGSALSFDYYDDGNLLRLTQRGGTNADGSFLPDRTFVFTYTTPDGSGPAIPLAADRVNPAAKTAQSTRVYSVRDPRGNETTFAYHGPTTSQLRWKLLSRTNRKGDVTSYGYDLVNRVTTVTEPLSRVTKFGYDTQGKVTAITDPMNRLTQVAWTTDRHVRRVTEPTGRFVEFAYNDNGYLTDRWDQLRNHTRLEYQNLQVRDSAGLGDSRDSSTYWKAGRTIPHLSQLISKTEPKGMATTTAGDFEWTFGYDGSGNLTSVVQPGPEDFTTNYAYNADGTISKVTHPPTHTTTGPVRAETLFPSYDANGFPTRIQDPAGTTTLEFDADGLLRWVQDPLHASSTGGAPENYRTFFYYDSFHRLGAQSTPKSTRFAPGELIWTSLEYDPNDNVIAQRTPSHTRGGGNRVVVVYDAMDRQIELTGPDTADGKTTLVWDPASRLDKVLLPKSSTVPGDQDHTIFYSYDPLDRVTRQTRHETTADTGSVIRSLHTHYCYDPAGDLVSVTAPNAGVATINCATPPTFTSKRVYDNAHRLTVERDPIGNETRYGYDANGNVRTVTDPRGRTQTLDYDQRDLVERVTQPFDQTRVPARDVVAKMQYDGAGNLTRSISPRAWDKSTDKVTFAEFVTEYRYDLANRLVSTDLPASAAKPQQHFLHYRYDPNGNLESTSLPVLSATSAPAEATTVMDYWDPGWIRTSRDATKKVLYDYTPEGWQSVRTPFTTPGGSELDLERRVSWSHYPDGMLREVVERDEGRSLYVYDEHNNLKKLDDSSGVKAPAESPFDIRATYDTLDRLKTVKDRKANEGPDDFRLSTYGYDLNGNVVDREDNALVKPAGTTAGRKHRFVYDEADWIRTQWDYGDEAGCADDQRITNDFFPTGWETERLIEKNDAACVLDKKQKTTWDYFDNGKLKVLKTFSWKDDPATADTTRVETLQESHTVSYEDGSGIYVNGHRTSDQFTLQGTNSGRCSTAPGCTARFFYDPRDRLERHEDGRGTATVYDLSTSGNILKETVTSPTGTKVTDYTYNGDQLATVTAGSSPTQRYYYDTLGRLDCIVLEGVAQSVCNQDASQVSPKVLAEYRFDDLDRLSEYSSYTTNGTTSSLDDTASYVYDALDRLVTETEGHGGSATKTTTAFTYQGLSRLATKEARTRSGSLVDSKTFSYDAVGNRISMNHSQPGSPVERFTYAYDVHGSTSLLIRDSGAVKAAYAYRPYGELDTSLSAGDVNPDDSFNPYRYSGHRYDSGSGSIDMGARRFSPGASRFLSPDMYLGALSDLGLSVDPLTGNRYGLAAGNPVSFMEVDGHRLAAIGPGNARVPTGPESGDPKLPDAGAVPSQVKGAGWNDLIQRTESFGVNGRLQPQCYNYPGTVSAARKLAGQCFEPVLGAAALNHAFWDMTGTGYNPGWEPPSEFEQAVWREIFLMAIPWSKVAWIGRGVNALRGARAASASKGGQVLLDANAVRSFNKATKVMKPGECPVICSTVQRELAEQGIASGLPGIADSASATLAGRVAANLRAFGSGARGLPADAVIGATAIERGIPLITGDQALYQAVLKLGGEARVFTPGG